MDCTDYNSLLADLLFPDVAETPASLRLRYPARSLPEGAMVTRLAPSPTGELHIGTLYAAFLSYRLALQSHGAFYVRLDDTDGKRETPGARARIPAQLRRSGIEYGEGYLGPDREQGAYGPYVQSARRDLYRVFAKALVRAGQAYPCFCTEAELTALRAEQKRQGAATGYYGPWARDRRRPPEETLALLRAKTPHVLRLRAPGRPEQLVCLHDLFKGEVRLPENVQDIVLLKSDGLPTYHFAHAVDDLLMGTTHVLRGDEWLSSAPIHLQLFEVLGQKPPVYGHIAPILKKEGDSKRKFSKRRDADGHIAYYEAQGIPPRALLEYNMHLINASYEDWRRGHPGLPLEAYAIDLNQLSVSGAVFDLAKLHHIAKNEIAGMSASGVLQALLNWSATFDPDFHALLSKDPDYALAVLSIDRGTPKPRKDLAQWSDARPLLGYFWDECFDPAKAVLPTDGPARAFLQAYAAAYDPGDSKDAWFARLKETAQAFGYAPDRTAARKEPGRYAGTIADAAAHLRRALTGLDATPDLYAIQQILGPDRVRARISAITGMSPR